VNYADLRCGLDAAFFAIASFAGFSPAIDINISFWPLAALRGSFEGFDRLECQRCCSAWCSGSGQ
jgi:hypothetical protein